jgi:replicative DNA helicase
MDENQLKTTPCSTDAERAILSCAMQWTESFDAISQHFAGDSLFYVPAHRTIWRAMNTCLKEGGKSDMVTVTAKLRERGELEGVGGPLYLADLYSDAATPTMLPDYLRIANNSAKRRRVIADCHELASDAYDSDRNIDETIQRLDTTVQHLLRTSSANRTHQWRQVISSGIETIQARMSAGGKLPGTSTGFEGLDEFTNGYQPGQVWVIGARPGSGKTALALNLAEHLGRADSPTAFFSAEMFADELAIRSLSSQTKLDSLKLARGDIGNHDLARLSQAIHNSLKWPIWVDDRPNMRLIDIQVATRNLVRENGVKVVFVDYLQLIKEPDGSRSREDAVRRLSEGFKQLAKEMAITVVCLAQLNRESEKRNNRKPQKSDLRDSGSIEQDANVILLLHEEDDDSGEPSMVIDVDIIVAKCRGGICGAIPFEFSKPTTTFTPRKKQ